MKLLLSKLLVALIALFAITTVTVISIKTIQAIDPVPRSFDEIDVGGGYGHTGVSIHHDGSIWQDGPHYLDAWQYISGTNRTCYGAHRNPMLLCDGSTVSFRDPHLENAIRINLNKPTGTLTPAELNTITTLDASGKSIQYLEGLQCLQSLTTLNLNNNYITDISILQYLPNLSQVFLADNFDLSNLNPLRLNTNFTTGDYLNVERINYTTDTCNNITAMKNHGVDIDYAPGCDSTPPNGQCYPIVFNDSNFEAAVRTLISIPSGDMNADHFTTFTDLDVHSTHTQYINGIECMHDLTNVNLSDNSIADITPLQNLTNLHNINLSNNLLLDNLNPLIQNTGFTAGDTLNVDHINFTTLVCQQIDTLKARGVEVSNVGGCSTVPVPTCLCLTEKINTQVRKNGTPFVFSNKLFIFGGTNVSDDPQDTAVYTSNGEVWSTTSTLPWGAEKAYITVFQGLLYVATSETVDRIVHLYKSSDGLSWTEVTLPINFEMGVAKNCLGIGTMGDTLHIFGYTPDLLPGAAPVTPTDYIISSSDGLHFDRFDTTDASATGVLDIYPNKSDLVGQSNVSICVAGERTWALRNKTRIWVGKNVGYLEETTLPSSALTIESIFDLNGETYCFYTKTNEYQLAHWNKDTNSWDDDQLCGECSILNKDTIGLNIVGDKNGVWIVGGSDGLTFTSSNSMTIEDPIARGDVSYSLSIDMEVIGTLPTSGSNGIIESTGIAIQKFNDWYYVIGGKDVTANDFSQSVYRTQDFNTWQTMTSSAAFGRRNNAALVVFNSQLYTLGGERLNGTYLNDVWTSTNNGATWTQVVAEAPWSDRWTLGNAVEFDNKLWLIGSSDTWCSLCGLEIWNTTNMIDWSHVSDLPNTATPSNEPRTISVWRDCVDKFHVTYRSITTPYAFDICSSDDLINWTVDNTVNNEFDFYAGVFAKTKGAYINGFAFAGSFLPRVFQDGNEPSYVFPHYSGMQRNTINHFSWYSDGESLYSLVEYNNNTIVFKANHIDLNTECGEGEGEGEGEVHDQWQNKGFEVWSNGLTVPDGWTVTSNGSTTSEYTQDAHEGYAAIKLTGISTTELNVSQNVVAIPGTSVDFRFWTKGGNGSYSIKDITHNQFIVSPTQTGTHVNYTLIAHPFIVPADCVAIKYILEGSHTSTTYFDIEAGTYTYLDNPGFAQANPQTPNNLPTIAEPKAIKFSGKMYVLDPLTQTIYSSQTGREWVTHSTSLPFAARHDCGFTNFNGEMWLFGGRNLSNSKLNDVWSSSDGITWVQKNNAYWSARSGMQYAVVGTKLFVIGGSSALGDQTDVWSTTDGLVWTQVTASADFNGVKSGYRIVEFNGKLYLTGGYNPTLTQNTSQVLTSTDGTTWTNITQTAPWTRRRDHYMQVAGGYLWVYGGVVGSTTRDYSLWETANGIDWYKAKQTNLPAMFDQATIGFGGHLWFIAGNQDAVPSNDVWYTSLWSMPDSTIHNLDPIDWTMMTGMAEYGTIKNGNATTFDSKLWAFDGETDNIWSSTDGRTWLSESQAATYGIRKNAGFVNAGTVLYLLGGRDNASSTTQMFSSTDGYNWTQYSANTTIGSVEGNSLVYFNNKVYAIGGKLNSGLTNGTWELNTGTSNFVALGYADFTPRMNFGCTVFDNKVWVVGGQTGATEADVANDVWYTSDMETWTCASNNADWSARSGCKLVSYNNHLMLIGGSNNGVPCPDELWGTTDGSTWLQTEASSPWSTRTGHCVTTFHDQIFLIGGSANNTDVWASANTQADQEIQSITLQGSSTTGYTGNSYLFSATANPSTSATPILYTWEAVGSTNENPVTHTVYDHDADTMLLTWLAPGNYIVKVTATNEYNSKSTTTQITIADATGDTSENLPPISDFTADKLSGPAPLTVKFVDQSNPKTSTITSWLWSFGDGVTSNLQNPTHVYSTVGTFTVTLTVTNSAGPDAETKTTYITTSAVDPIANFTANKTAGTSGLTVQFTSQSSLGTGTNPTYSWSFGDSTPISNLQNPSHIYQVAGTHSVALTVTTSTGSNTITKTNFVNVTATPIVPVADCISNTAAPIVGESVQFKSTSNPGSSTISTYAWNFGDSGTANTINPTHTYTTAGTYTVTLTVTTSAGTNTVTKTNMIVVSTITPRALAVANVTSVTPGTTVSFRDLSLPGTATITDWAWTFGDTSSSIEQNPTHQYNTVGTYTVTLAVTSSVNMGTQTLTNYIVVRPVKPKADFTASNRTGLAPLTVKFINSTIAGSSPVVSWLWEFGDTTTSTLETPPDHTYSTVGSYTVSLTATNATGHTTCTKTAYVVVNPVGPSVDFIADQTSGSSPLSVQFTDLSNPGTSSIVSWAWTFGDGGTSTSQNPSHIYTMTGSKNVSLTVTTAVGNATKTKNSYITVASVGPNADFTATPTAGSIPLTVQFTDKSNPGSSAITAWYWTFGDNTTSTQQNPSHQYSVIGTYSVALRVTTNVGSDTEMKTNLIASSAIPVAPTALFSANPVTGSIPLTVQFTDQSTPGTQAITSWAWSFGDGQTATTQHPSHQYQTPGTKTVSLTVTTSVNPPSTLTKTNYITVNPVGPTANFISNITTGNEPLTVQFTDRSTAGTSTITAWSWNFGDSTTSTDQSPSHTYSTFGNYTVALTVTTAVGSNTKTNTNYIQVVAARPSAAFSANSWNGYEGVSIRYYNQSTAATGHPITAHLWDFGDGQTSISSGIPYIDHTYTSAGVYTVSLTETATDLSDTETKVGYIHVNQPVKPTGITITGPTTLQVDETGTFTATVTPSSTAQPIAYTWSDGTTLTGGSISTDRVRSWNSAGIKTLSITATSYGTTVTSADFTVTISADNPTPVISAYTEDTNAPNLELPFLSNRFYTGNKLVGLNYVTTIYNGNTQYNDSTNPVYTCTVSDGAYGYLVGGESLHKYTLGSPTYTTMSIVSHSPCTPINLLGTPYQIDGATTSIFLNNLYLIGGVHGFSGYPQTYNPLTYISNGLDIPTWTTRTTATLPARKNHGSCVYKDKLWVACGVGSTYNDLSDLWSTVNGITWVRATNTVPKTGAIAGMFATHGRLWIAKDTALICTVDGLSWNTYAISEAFAPTYTVQYIERASNWDNTIALVIHGSDNRNHLVFATMN